MRKWKMRAKLWRGKRARVREVHTWRPRRSRFGELVQWDTSEHDWLEGRGERLYLIAMIDDATSRLFARFVRHDTTEENMRLLAVFEILHYFACHGARMHGDESGSVDHNLVGSRLLEPDAERVLAEWPVVLAAMNLPAA